MSPFQLTIILIILLFAALYTWLKSRYRYWKVRHIPYLEPNLLLGNAGDLVLGRKSLLEYQKHMYAIAKDKKIFGIFMFQKPTLYICDLNLIKNILGRDSAHFFDRGIKFDSDNEPLTKHLFHLEGEEYKIVRNKVMPGFTINGILILFPMLLESANNLKDYLGQISKTTQDLNLKNIMSRYAAEVIGKCAFGLQKGPLTDDNVKFYEMSEKIFSPRMRTLIKLILPKLPNVITELFDIKMIESEVSQYFTQIMKTEIRNRRSRNKRPSDFLSFMMDLQDHDDKYCTDNMPITENLIMAHCFMLFIAGYENTTGVLCAALFELARNQNVQEKLYTEIKRICVSEDGEFQLNFQKISEMTYLHQVICEVLRLYPPATALVRECTEKYQIPGTTIVIEKDQQVIIPVIGINTDYEYFPSQDTFDPENFNEQAIKSRSRYAFLAFGDGPRACVGRKFGMIQMKVGLATLILHYKFFPSPMMKLPLEFEKQTFITSIHGGAWVRCKPR